MWVVKLAAGECYGKQCNLRWARLCNGVYAIYPKLPNVFTDCEIDGVAMGRARPGTLRMCVARSAIIDCMTATQSQNSRISDATANGLIPS